MPSSASITGGLHLLQGWSRALIQLQGRLLGSVPNRLTLTYFPAFPKLSQWIGLKAPFSGEVTTVIFSSVPTPGFELPEKGDGREAMQFPTKERSRHDRFQFGSIWIRDVGGNRYARRLQRRVTIARHAPGRHARNAWALVDGSRR